MAKLVQAIGRILKNRWLLLLIGLLCIGTLIWFLGPLIHIGDLRPLESMTARLSMIVILVVLWGMNNLRLAYQDRRRSQEINAELVGSNDKLADPDHRKALAEEIGAMTRGFEHIARRLKRVSQGGIGDKRGLYQLPWYLVLGQPAAGKTTLLQKSGLRFSLIAAKDQQSSRAVEGRYCQWWLADEAVIVDTAGRHALQNSTPTVDRLAWQKLVALLQKHRPRQPINGIILVVSMADLLTSDHNQRLANADAIRNRLQELSLEFKHSIPVYCVITKCDQVAGFVEFFRNLDRKSKEQVWGITFGLEDGIGAESPIETFGDAYDQLIERLQARLVEHLNREPEIGSRARIQDFPMQMQLQRQPLNDHLTDIFKPSRFDSQIQLRGVYFTSAVQAGTPIDRLTSLLTAMFGIKAQPLSAFSGTTFSYFLKPLLMDVIFRESGLVTNSASSIRRRKLIRRAVAACASLLLVTTGLAWWISFNRNQDYISTVEAKVAEFDQNANVLSEDITDISSPLPIFNLLRTIPGGYADREQAAPLAAGFGLNQRDKLGSATSAAYQRILQSALLPRLIN
ncbi:MAG: type VI secretion system membrane subunit TssM, partial [Geminicoccaceae bacterium]